MPRGALRAHCSSLGHGWAPHCVAGGLALTRCAPSIGEQSGWRPLHSTASQHGKLDIARLLIERGADVDADDAARRHPRRALCGAAGCAAFAAPTRTHALSKRCGAQDGITPLHLAVRKGNLDLVQLLLEHGADQSIKTYVRCAAT